MTQDRSYLTRDAFRHVIESAPLVSIDFMIRNQNGEFLLGLRTNAPAKNYWFNLGGRIRKNEIIPEAQKRIFRDEVGGDHDLSSARFIGVYDHVYDDNVFNDVGYGTHYVCLTYMVDVSFNDAPTLLSQHERYVWMSADDILASETVHENTKVAFRDLKNN